MRFSQSPGRISVVLLLLTLGICFVGCQTSGPLRRIGSGELDVGYDLFVRGGAAYISSNNGVAIFDVVDPKQPTQIGKIDIGPTFALAVENGRIYAVAGGDFTVIEAANPKHLAVVATYPIGSPAYQILVKDNLAYIASEDGLTILDISVPSAPELVSRFSDGGTAWGVAIHEGRAYLADSLDGVEIIDVSDPALPAKVNVVAGTEGARAIHIRGSTMVVACHSAGIRILSLSTSEMPEIVGSFSDNDGGEALDVWGDGRYIFVADNFGIEVLDANNPEKPSQIAEYTSVKAAQSLQASNGLIFVAEYDGLLILQLETDGA